MTYQQPVRRRHRGLRALAIFLVVLVVLLVVADRVGEYVAERIAGDTIQTSQHLSSRPGVEIAGFPFLDQLATGNFDQVTVTAADVPVGNTDHRLQIDRVRVVLDRVHTARDFSSVHADTALATATVGYAHLSSTLGIDVRYTGGGKITASRTFTVLGQSVTPTISVEPRIVNGALEFANPAINGLTDLAGDAADTLKKVFDVTVPFTGLPFDIAVRSLSVAPSGLIVSLSGTNINYTDANA